MFDCVILAAGASSRMRALIKPLLPFGGSTLVESAVGAAFGAGARVLLVLGNRGGEVAALFDAEKHRASRDEGNLVLVENLGWEAGMVGSIRAGSGSSISLWPRICGEGASERE